MSAPVLDFWLSLWLFVDCRSKWLNSDFTLCMSDSISFGMMAASVKELLSNMLV